MKIESFMVRDPVTAALWEPISFVRQRMLTRSFSFLPVQMDTGEWRFVSDRALARLIGGCSGVERKKRLCMRLGSAIANADLELDDATLVPLGTDVGVVARGMRDRPVLVISRDQAPRLLGIVTAFDLL